MEVHHFLTLYLTSPTAVTVDAVQGDGVRVIAARLMAGAEPWPVPEGVTAGIGYELPDKKSGYYDQLADGTPACMIAGNLVTAAIDGSLTATAGNVKLSIILRDSEGGQVATFPVTMRVTKRPGRIGAEEMAPPNAYEGKLLMGGQGGETVPVAVGSGLFLERTPTGATLSAPGGGDPDAPGGSCDCGALYIAGEEPPEDPDVLWINTRPPGEVVALGVTAEETPEGVVLHCTDELGTTKVTVRHGRDGAPGTTPVKGVDYFLPAEIEEVARQAAGLVEVPVGGSEEWEYIGEFTAPEDVDAWTVTEDADGNPIRLKKLYFEMTAQPSEGATGNASLAVGNPAFSIWWGAAQLCLSMTAGLRTTKTTSSAHVFYIPAGDTYHMIGCYSTAAHSLTWGRAVNHGQHKDVDCFEGIAFRSGTSSTARIGAGSTVKIWGVRR